ncbi:MAG: Uma2 family endonuclease [Chroococcidiopsidaceae cyanobacterium CP_BM_ER_R8_30]|nr:Uma2 family endonuclease [Chroococcidiopsidaceae cyanobacterium CP_BM_ER_R8_30]
MIANKTPSIPPLEGGDRLSRPEFERRYHAAPHIKKAELIEGVVYVPSPVRARSHSQPHGWIITWLGVYEAATPGVSLHDNSTVRLDLDNEPQPDALLRIEVGGRSRITEDDYIEGAPELIVEVAASSAAYDLHDKKRAYRRNGVQEYLVWRVLDQTLDWFCLQAGEYGVLQPDEYGVIRSQVFPGLWLMMPALVTGNIPSVLATLQTGIDSPEHARFVEQLSERTEQTKF